MRLLLLLALAFFDTSVYAQAVRYCEGLSGPKLPGAIVLIESKKVDAGVCRVTVVVTHPPAKDQVRVFVGLPLNNWNGRFQGVGGGGFTAGDARRLAPALAAGFVAVATDAGHSTTGGSFALDSSGRLDWLAIRNFAHASIHEMTVIGKLLTVQFYERGPTYSYFNGCSTGGRQGLMEVQRYPADYDGVLAGAPAINWAKLHVAQMWGQLAMLEANHYLPACKFQAAQAAAVSACDKDDGAADGVIADPRRCSFDPAALIGKPTACGEFSEADARIIRKIWEGPKREEGGFLWYGLPRGAPFQGLSATGGEPITGKPSGITLDWWKYFLTQNPNFEWTSTKQAMYEQVFDQSVEEFNTVIGTDDADITGFQKRGGKVLVWHGWADPLIYPQGTIEYYERVREKLGAKIDDVMRLYLAPGVGHCGGGEGAPPQAPFQALQAWVEQGVRPETLAAVRRDQAGKVVRSRPLCRYPGVAKYKGAGNIDDAASFTCLPQ